MRPHPPSQPPTIRRVLASSALALALGLAAVSLLDGFSQSPILRLLEAVAVLVSGALLLGGVAVVFMVRLAGWRQPEAEFEALVVRSERLAAEDPWSAEDAETFDVEDVEDYEDPEEDLFDPRDEDDFRAVVRSALDELPLEFHRALEHVAVVVSDGGRQRRAYGVYEGDTVARDHFHERILIFRDTLTRDFGHDPDLLRAQVARTVRHELAHHLGWDERGVRGLGL